MGTSTSEMLQHGGHLTDLFGVSAIVFALLGAGIMVWYLISHPPLTRRTKLWLLMGIGVFPIMTALTGNVNGFVKTQNRDFCGGCHVMGAYTGDSDDDSSLTLASLHARNESFGDKNCYSCHADYGMFGSITTKLGSLSHVYHYYGTYRTMTQEDALKKLKLYRPYPNVNCTQCHSMIARRWKKTKEHNGALEEIKLGEMSCVSSGCHGPAHPFSKPEQVKTATRTSTVGGAP